MKLTDTMSRALSTMRERRDIAAPGVCPNVTPGVQLAKGTANALVARGLAEFCTCRVDHVTRELRLVR